MARHRLSMRARTRQGQITPSELDTIAASFAQAVKERMLQLGVSRVYNANETGSFMSIYTASPLCVHITSNDMKPFELSYLAAFF